MRADIHWGQRRLEARPVMLCNHYILSISGTHVIVGLALVVQTWRIICDNKATDLNGCDPKCDHLYAYCVWKERLWLLVQGMSCVELECCELHVSFVDISRIALCPSVVKWRKVEEMFAECNSPLLTEIYSTCAFKVRLLYDLIDR